MTQQPDEKALLAAVTKAQGGNRDALERVIASVQDDVYGIALRMTGHTQDAEDACQEVLVKIITRLGGFRGESSVRTWAYRVAVNHLLDRKKGRLEKPALDFSAFGADLLDGLADEPDPDPLLATEVKHGCTLAMLTCLDREHRLAYILADVFEYAGKEAAELCNVSEHVYRQRVSRARRLLTAFTESYCGLVNVEAPCRCSRRVAKAIELGRIAAVTHSETVNGATHEMETMYDTARLMRSHPEYHAPARITDFVRKTLDGGKLGLSIGDPN